MEPISASSKLQRKPIQKNKFLHSPNHLLADELSLKLADTKHFGFYLKMATMYDHNVLRRLAGQIMENKNAKTPGKLFAFLIKKQNEEDKSKSWLFP